MKHLMIAIFFFVKSVYSYSQDTLHYAFSLKDNKIYYERIVDVPGKKKENLYTIAKSWGVNNFNSQKDVMQADDKESGILAYKFFFKKAFHQPKLLGVENIMDWQYWQVMKVFLKDEKAKIIIEDVQLKDIGYSGYTIETFKSSTESYFKKNMMGKGYREKYYAETYKSFKNANSEILAIMDSLEKTLKSGKSDFDF
jgi:hypothetical protein